MTHIGVVATNQERKDWGLTAEVTRMLANTLPEFKAWWHIDTLRRAWDIDALIADYGLEKVVEVTLAPMPEQELVERYRQCDVTLAPGSGEGFCFPAWESLACNVPVVHGNYAACASLMGTCGLGHLLVEPCGWRLEGQYNARRPIYDPNDWVQTITQVPTQRDDWRGKVAHLDWPNLGPRFMKWFDDGIQVVTR